MRAQPGFLSAEDLLEQVWDEHADPFTKTVGVTVSRLRRKPVRARDNEDSVRFRKYLDSIGERP